MYRLHYLEEEFPGSSHTLKEYLRSLAEDILTE
jgi:hypothetical protein